MPTTTKPGVSVLVAALWATTVAIAAEPASPPAGSADFDFNDGVWKSQVRRTVAPLSGSAEAIELRGTVSVRKIWDGAHLEEIEADGPNGHWQGLTLFVFDPQSKQWSQAFANSKQGILGAPSIGEFRRGIGELYSMEPFQGRTILIHNVWSEIKPDSHRYEESYSDDGGKSWHPAFLVHLTRATSPGTRAPAGTAATDVSRAFDFELGKWKTHISRLLHPLSGKQEWAESDGTIDITPVWGGKGNLAHVVADGPSGHTELLSLRLHDPTARQWRISLASRRGGLQTTPLIGEVKDGRGVFFDQEEIGGRTVWVRLTIASTSPDTVLSEQAFSDDQGKTWETNFISRQTRMP